MTVTTKTTATANGAASAPSPVASTTTRKSSSVSTRSKVGSRDAQFSEPEVIHDPPEEELDEAEVDEPKSIRKSGSNRKSLIPRSSFKVNTSQGQVDLEEKSDFELGELMKSIGLRFASIDSRNRPNYYRRIKDKLNHVTNDQSIDRTNEFRYYSIILIWKLKLKINFKAQTTTVKANSLKKNPTEKIKIPKKKIEKIREKCSKHRNKNKLLFKVVYNLYLVNY